MKFFKNIAISIMDGSLIGLAVGLACTGFLYLLSFSTNTFQSYPQLLYFLPLCGISSVWLYKRFGEQSLLGNHLIIDEIHNPSRSIPLIMAPLIFITTILSHLFGASVGREGTAIQMGASLSEGLGKKMGISPIRRKSFLIAGMGAGFSSALGAPIAGIIFGMEVLHLGKFKFQAIIQSVFASIIAYAVTILCKAPHSHYPAIDIYFSWQTIIYLFICAILWGLVSRIFINSLHFSDKLFNQLFSNPYSKILAGSFLLIILFSLEGTTLYNGLGIETIQHSFLSNLSWLVPVKKFTFTVLSIAAGFKGGEFTPLAFIGATIGSSFASYFAVSTSLFASLGFSALFGSSSKTPLACTIMAAELFGLGILPYAIIACFISYFVSGSKSIYRFQQ